MSCRFKKYPEHIHIILYIEFGRKNDNKIN
jgi:hypothetical protein